MGVLKAGNKVEAECERRKKKLKEGGKYLGMWEWEGKIVFGFPHRQASSGWPL